MAENEEIYIEYIGVHLCTKCFGEMKRIEHPTRGWVKRVCYNCNIVIILGMM